MVAAGLPSSRRTAKERVVGVLSYILQQVARTREAALQDNLALVVAVAARDLVASKVAEDEGGDHLEHLDIAEVEDQAWMGAWERVVDSEYRRTWTVACVKAEE